MKNASYMNHARKALTAGITLLITLAAFVGIADEASATDLDPGWAIIVGLNDGSVDHTQEAMNLRSYLLERGWDDEQIIFLCPGDMPYIDGYPTKRNFKRAINHVARVSTSDDLVFIAVLDHGVDGEDGKYYLRFGEDLDRYMSDRRFGRRLDRIENYRTMVVDIAGSYSGAFIDNAEGNNRIVVADCSPTETYLESEYSFYEALTDMTADTDYDGQVSVEEAYALMLDSMHSTTPQIDDPNPDSDVVIPEF